MHKETGRIIPAHNSRFAKAGVSCFYESEVLNSSFVHLIKFSAENPRLSQSANRYAKILPNRLKINELTIYLTK